MPHVTTEGYATIQRRAIKLRSVAATSCLPLATSCRKNTYKDTDKDT